MRLLVEDLSNLPLLPACAEPVLTDTRLSWSDALFSLGRALASDATPDASVVQRCAARAASSSFGMRIPDAVLLPECLRVVSDDPRVGVAITCFRWGLWSQATLLAFPRVILGVPVLEIDDLDRRVVGAMREEDGQRPGLWAEIWASLPNDVLPGEKRLLASVIQGDRIAFPVLREGFPAIAGLIADAAHGYPASDWLRVLKRRRAG